MVKFVKFMILALFIMSTGVSLAADEGWKKVGESEGIINYARPTTRSSVDEIKSVGIVDAPVAVVEAVIRDIPAMPEYIFLCKEAFVINTPEMKSGGDVIYFYSLTDLPFPASDRDAVEKSVFSIDKKTGTVYCHAEGVKTNYKLNSSVVRMPLSIIDATLIPKGANKTEVIYQVLGDPGGQLPSFIVNMLISDYGIKTITGLRQMVKKEKYKSFNKVITTTPKSPN